MADLYAIMNEPTNTFNQICLNCMMCKECSLSSSGEIEMCHVQSKEFGSDHNLFVTICLNFYIARYWLEARFLFGTIHCYVIIMLFHKLIIISHNCVPPTGHI